MKLWKAILATALLVGLCSCNRGEMGYSYIDTSEVETGQVFIFYAPASSNLAPFISRNITSITKSGLPHGSSRKTVLTFAHMDSGEAHLLKISADEFGNPVSDTLLTVEAGRSASDPEIVSRVLGKVVEEYPESSNIYTLIMSSHGTGWLPRGATADFGNDVIVWDSPRKKSFGSEKINGVFWDISIQDLAAAIPMKLESLIFDACLMGGIEVAYELREKVGKLCVSAAEVPGNGFIYSEFASDLLADAATPEYFSKVFFEHYKVAQETGTPSEDSYYGATVTVVDCSKLAPLADVCTTLFEKYRTAIAALNPAEVQRYHRIHSSVDYYRDFFDLEDILLKAGINAEEKASLEAALEGCITYKDATSSFMKNFGGFDIDCYSGLSMYLPNKGNATLDEFYKTLAWNKATKLVE